MPKVQPLDFAPNYCHAIEIDITPNESTPTWRSALEGITSVQPAADETKDEDEFYDKLGQTETTVTNVKASIALTGFRKYGSEVQDFVQSKALLTGNDRKTGFRWTHPDGTFFQGTCNLCDIVPGSGMGDANAKGDFSFTMALDTIDTIVIGNDVNTPESITATDVTTTVGGTAAVDATIAPTGSNQKAFFAIEDDSIATVDADGNIKGVAAGSTTLTIKAASKPSIVKQIKVTVSAA